MKHATLIFILLISGSAKLLAQPYLSYANQWTSLYSVANFVAWPIQYTYTYKYYYVNGDSVFNNYTYKKIYETHRYCGYSLVGPGSPCNSVPHSAPGLAGLLRESGPRWYFRSGNVEDLLYRFDLVKGDTLRKWNDTQYVTVDTVFLNYQGTGLKYFQVKTSQGTIPHTGIIEGVGPDIGFLSFLFNPFESPVEQLTCYRTQTISSTCLPWPELITGLEEQTGSVQQIIIYPNPANTALFLTLTTQQAGTIKLINALGQTVQQQEVKAGDKSATLVTHEIPDGMYLLQLESANRSVNCKRVVIGH